MALRPRTQYLLGQQTELTEFSHGPMDGLRGIVYMVQFLHRQYTFLNL